MQPAWCPCLWAAAVRCSCECFSPQRKDAAFSSEAAEQSSPGDAAIRHPGARRKRQRLGTCRRSPASLKSYQRARSLLRPPGGTTACGTGGPWADLSLAVLGPDGRTMLAPVGKGGREGRVFLQAFPEARASKTLSPPSTPLRRRMHKDINI